ncbi:hypothetical protein FRC12_015920 [Ceratobasidium sp. 428]|nr:hypothetical protein FRC12_015920 [Ceratobasidium sp. 428]
MCPKREIHPPLPKDLLHTKFATNGKRPRKGKAYGAERDDGAADQLHHCVASPFYEPVDVNYVPNYYKVIKRPMNLATTRKKLDDNECPDAHAFHNDFRLMIKNRTAFNPPDTTVYFTGLQTDRTFKVGKTCYCCVGFLPRKTKTRTAAKTSTLVRTPTVMAIVMMESQIKTMRESLATLKAKKKGQKPKAAGRSSKEARAKGIHPAKNATPGKKAKNGAGSDTERSISTMSFEQKGLSTTIEFLDDDKLEKVIQIIYEGMPDLQNSNEEIELDIESLSPAVLTKLWNFVVKSQQQKKSVVSSNGPKRTSGNTFKGAATAGVIRRNSTGEAVERERAANDARLSGASASESSSGSGSD